MKSMKLMTIGILSGLALVLVLEGSALAGRGFGRGDRGCQSDRDCRGGGDCRGDRDGCGGGDCRGGASCDGGGRMGRLPGSLSGLDLTREQREKIRDVAESHRDEARKALDKVRQLRDGLRQDILSGKSAEAAIRERARALGEAMGDELVLESRLAGEARKILTPEQQEKLKQAGQDGGGSPCGRGHQRRGRW